MAEPALRFERVTREFRSSGGFFAALLGRPTETVKAVDDVSFDLHPGEILGLIGQSGSGKTTSGLLAIKLLDPTSGSIYVNGQDLAALHGESLRGARRHFQIVFQDPYQSLNPRMNVLRLLEEPLKIHAPETSRLERLSRVREALEEVGLHPPELFLHRFPHELSGGQRQRVAIGRAVIMKPNLLIADEPVSMLDVSVRAGILRVLLNLRTKMGMSQLFITHDLAVAKHVCDRIAVMHSGRIVEMGPSRTILSTPSDDYTRELMRAVPDLRQIIAEKSRQAA